MPDEDDELTQQDYDETPAEPEPEAPPPEEPTDAELPPDEPTEPEARAPEVPPFAEADLKLLGEEEKPDVPAGPPQETFEQRAARFAMEQAERLSRMPPIAAPAQPVQEHPDDEPVTYAELRHERAKAHAEALAHSQAVAEQMILKNQIDNWVEMELDRYKLTAPDSPMMRDAAKSRIFAQLGKTPGWQRADLQKAAKAVLRAFYKEIGVSGAPKASGPSAGVSGVRSSGTQRPAPAEKDDFDLDDDAARYAALSKVAGARVW